jgi:hypothetical protein
VTHTTAQHDQRRVEEVHKTGDGVAEVLAGALEQGERRSVPSTRRRSHVLRGDPAAFVERRGEDGAATVTCRLLTGRAEGATAGDRLETAGVAAAAAHVRVRRDLDVPDVARCTLRPAVELSVGDEPGADARAHLHVDHVVVPAGDAVAPLAERHHVHVVVDPHGDAEPRREPIADRIAVPAGHDRRRHGQTAAELDRARDPDADGADRRVAASPCDEAREQLLEATEHLDRTVRDVGRLAEMRQDGAAEIGERDIDAGRAEVGDEERPGIRREPHVARRPAAGARCRAVRDDETAVREFRDALRGDGAREAGRVHHLGPRPRAVDPDHVEDVGKAVVTTRGAHGAVGRRSSAAGPGCWGSRSRAADVGNGPDGVRARRHGRMVLLRVKRKRRSL